jgi:hypothetical protein
MRTSGNTESPVYRGQLSVASPGAATGVFASMANPWGREVLIHSAFLRITTQSTGASTIDVGVAADAVTANDVLIDGVSGAAAGLFNSVTNAGTNGKVGQIWGASQFLNAAEASGDVTAIVAVLHFDYSFL